MISHPKSARLDAGKGCAVRSRRGKRQVSERINRSPQATRGGEMDRIVSVDPVNPVRKQNRQGPEPTLRAPSSTSSGFAVEATPDRSNIEHPTTSIQRTTHKEGRISPHPRRIAPHPEALCGRKWGDAGLQLLPTAALTTKRGETYVRIAPHYKKKKIKRGEKQNPTTTSSRE